VKTRTLVRAKLRDFAPFLRSVVFVGKAVLRSRLDFERVGLRQEGGRNEISMRLLSVGVVYTTDARGRFRARRRRRRGRRVFIPISGDDGAVATGRTGTVGAGAGAATGFSIDVRKDRPASVIRQPWTSRMTSD
jgi:hypothetical protein